jgi:hypothetical protein
MSRGIFGILSFEFHVAEEHDKSMTRRIKYVRFFSGIRNHSFLLKSVREANPFS